MPGTYLGRADREAKSGIATLAGGSREGASSRSARHPSPLGRPRWLAGTFVWKAFSAPVLDGGSEADFRFLGRKAEGGVREYYGKPEGK